MNDEIIEGRCLVCGKKLRIELKGNGEYKGGHYFGILKIPVGEGEHEIIGKSKISDMEFDIVEWTGDYREEEYWECESCFNEE